MVGRNMERWDPPRSMVAWLVICTKGRVNLIPNIRSHTGTLSRSLVQLVKFSHPFLACLLGAGFLGTVGTLSGWNHLVCLSSLSRILEFAGLASRASLAFFALPILTFGCLALWFSATCFPTSEPWVAYTGGSAAHASCCIWCMKLGSPCIVGLYLLPFISIVVSGMSSALKLPKRLKVVLYSSVDCSCKAQGS